jgi:hypothetical protein
VFYWSFGWLTVWLPLPQVAWIGRLMTWGLLAAGWRGLSFAVVPMRGFAVLSAGLVVCLWAWGHMAGEWVVGGVEAKGFAYALVLFGVRALVLQRWRQTWLWLGAASSFHVLVGGWSVVAAGVAWLLLGRARRAPLSSMVPALLGGLILALPGIIPVLWLNVGVDDDLVWQANRIYVFRRLAHHLILREMPPLFVIRFVVMLVVWALLGRWLCRLSEAYSRLGAFVGGTVLIAAAGAVLELWTFANPFWASFWLRFYWFRLSDSMVPAGLALASGVVLRDWTIRRPVVSQWLFAILIGIATIGLAGHMHERRHDPRPAADRQGTMERHFEATDPQVVYLDWRAICEWARANTSPEARFLTPVGQQTFKWYAQRNEVVTWKDVPQDAVGLLAWWQRYRRVRGLESPDLGPLAFRQRLRRLAARYDAQYLVAVRQMVPAGSGLRPVYANSTFAVYAISERGGAGAVTRHSGR